MRGLALLLLCFLITSCGERSVSPNALPADAKWVGCETSGTVVVTIDYSCDNGKIFSASIMSCTENGKPSAVAQTISGFLGEQTFKIDSTYVDDKGRYLSDTHYIERSDRAIAVFSVTPDKTQKTYLTKCSAMDVNIPKESEQITRAPALQPAPPAAAPY